MVVRIPSSLKWLINRRARLLADIVEAKKNLSNYDALILEHENQLRQSKINLSASQYYIECLEKDLKTIDSTILLHEIPIDPNIINPVKTVYKRMRFRHGEITRLIYTSLKNASNKTCSTTEIATFIAFHHQLNLDSNSFTKLRSSVANRLKNLALIGNVVRLHNPKSTHEGRWTLGHWNELSRIGRPPTY